MNTWSWLAWLVASLVFVSTTRNPLYLSLLLLVFNIVFLVCDDRSAGTSLAIVSPLKFSLFILPIATIFNSLTSHYGETELFSIPGVLPLISGPVTAEAIVFGFVNGLVLSAMLSAFTVINVALPISAVIRLIPRAFYPLSIVVSIAVTFLPSTRRQINQVLEAQAIRGHKVKGFRDWLPLLIPLLISSLERSMQLAETMTARGFASHTEAQKVESRAFIFGGLLLVIIGWVARLMGQDGLISSFMLSLGIILIGVAFWQVGKQMPRTSFRKQRWQTGDLWLLGSSLGVLLLLLIGLPETQKATMFYQPYPKVELPPFNAGIGFLTLVLLAPVLFTHSNYGQE